MRSLELHACAKQVKRSAGRSSVAAAAYRAGACLHDERTGLTHDYTRKGGVEHSRIYLPDSAPALLADREALWNAAERKENRSNSCTAHELEISFPAEFHSMQRREAGNNIAQELMKRYGCAVDIAYHKPSKGGDERNFHAHILFTTRGFDDHSKDGWARTKFRGLSEDKITVNGEKTTRGKQEILSLRAFVASEMNRIAQRDKLHVKVEHLSFEKRGIDRDPQVHMGPVANDIERKGRSSDIGDLNRAIDKTNQHKAKVHKELLELKFDEWAERKRARLQTQQHDQLIRHDRDSDLDRDALQQEIDKHYKTHLKTVKHNISVLQVRLQRKGVGRLWHSATGKAVRDRQVLQSHRRSLANVQWRIREMRTTRLNKINANREGLEQQHDEQKYKLEREISNQNTRAMDDYKEVVSGVNKAIQRLVDKQKNMRVDEHKQTPSKSRDRDRDPPEPSRDR